MSDTELTICQMVYDQSAMATPTPVIAAEMPRPIVPPAVSAAPTAEVQRHVAPPTPPAIMQRPTPPPPPPPPVVQRPAPAPMPQPAPMPTPVVTPRPEPQMPIPRPMAAVVMPVAQAQPAPAPTPQPAPMRQPPMPKPMPPVEVPMRPVPRAMMMEMEMEMEMEMTVEKTKSMPMERPMVKPAATPMPMECAMTKPAPMPLPAERPMMKPTAMTMPVMRAAMPASACLDLPYPALKDIEKNDCYAKIILNLYAGRVSELSAVMSYFYNSITFENDCAEAHTIFDNIAICEMQHLEMLAELLLKLGTAPKFYSIENGCARWWSANPCCFTYASCLGIAILNAIDDEKKAIRAYSDAICQIDNNQIALLLRRIIMDEEHHIKLLTSLYERCIR